MTNAEIINQKIADCAIRDLIAAMNRNNELRQPNTPYAGFEITETRRKYHLLNSILTNGQRSGMALIDRETLVVFRSTGYGKTDGRRVGTVQSLTAEYLAATATMERA